MILCVTRRYDILSNPLMTISIDSVEISYSRDVFLVLEDPQVINMYLSGYDTPLRVTSVSGGLDYELIGINLGATVTQILEFSQDGRIISRSVRSIYIISFSSMVIMYFDRFVFLRIRLQEID